jgi:hypothetical protein
MYVPDENLAKKRGEVEKDWEKFTNKAGKPAVESYFSLGEVEDTGDCGAFKNI